MFIVTLVLNEVIAWMRSQSGTVVACAPSSTWTRSSASFRRPRIRRPSSPCSRCSSRRAPSGWACVLATQNPVDLDYKGLANCGTWFIGRLQTERDKLRVIEGLKSALAGAEDGADLEALMSSLTQRVFLMRNVHDDAPVLMKTRWALSYLRGPLTGPEIARVMACAQEREPSAAPAATRRQHRRLAAAPRGAPRRWARESPSISCAPTKGAGPVLYKPMIAGFAQAALRRLRSSRSTSGRPRAGWRPSTTAAAMRPGKTPRAMRSSSRASAPRRPTARSTASCPAPRCARRATPPGRRSLQSHLYETARATLLVLRRIQGGLEGRRERGRLPRAPRRWRRARSATRRSPSCARRWQAKLLQLQDQIRRAEERREREKSQLIAAEDADRGVHRQLDPRAPCSAARRSRRPTSIASAPRRARRRAWGHESQDVDARRGKPRSPAAAARGCEARSRRRSRASRNHARCRARSRCAPSKCRRANPTSPSAKWRWCGRRGARAPMAFPRRRTTDTQQGISHERTHRHARRRTSASAPRRPKAARRCCSRPRRTSSAPPNSTSCSAACRASTIS